MWRVGTVFTFFVLIFLAIISRLFYWQVVRGEELRLAAQSQHYLQLTLPATRGLITANDESLLVINQPAFLVYASPKEISDKQEFTKQVAKILNLDYVQLIHNLSQPGRVWVPLSHKVENKLVNQLKTLALKGIGFESEPKRYYPEASTAAHLLGFVGVDQNNQDQGYFGLEGYYERELKGKDGFLRVEKDIHGAPIYIGEVQRIEPENGRNLKLWLDRSIQYFAEKRLKDGIQKYGAKEGSVVIMDPATGGILAMASYPNYAPSAYTKYPKEYFKNPVVGNSFEPGSTFKALIMAAGLNEKVVTPQTQFEEKGQRTIGEYSIRTWNQEYHGIINMAQVLQYSSNVGMVFVGEKLGKDKLLDYVKNFGFGELTDIDLQDESSALLRPDRDWREIDLATLSFGQGIAVTPIQMVRAVAALANGGWLMQPRVVAEISDEHGRKTVFEPRKIKQVISPTTAKIITEMLINAVDQGEAKWAKPKGYRIAGKTGTAQIPVAGHYDETKTIASFVGFAPADNPRFVMLVTLREPTSSPWGSETAAPLFFAIARDILHYWGLPPQP